MLYLNIILFKVKISYGLLIKAFLFRQLFFVPAKKNCPAQYKNKLGS